jgi:methylated-DNA-[protein]-cysteine S-methyltransferase
MTARQLAMNSPIGTLYLVASSQGLQGIFWSKQSVPLAVDLKEKSPPVQHLRQAQLELTEYFERKRRKFEVPLDIQGTPFQKKVWGELRKIPYGKMLSYKEVALRIGTNGIRAVGTANGRNPLSIIIPCHRVIASGGGLGGYTGGLGIKKHLLSLEQSWFHPRT